MSTKLAIILAAGLAGTLASASNAAMIDLTIPNNSGTINGAVFFTNDDRATGTGVYIPFVRIQANETEHGYNTSGSPVPFDGKVGTWTHDLQISQLLTRMEDGVLYYDFRLDINQNLGSDHNLLSLDQVRIFTSPVGSQTTTNVSSLGTERYNMDAGGDSWVKLDYELQAGSGQGDMTMMIPVSYFAGASSDDYVYVYSVFGENYASNDGFEEWAIRGVVPTPGPLVVASIGALLIARRRR
jgi:hypothetical protein